MRLHIERDPRVASVGMEDRNLVEMFDDNEPAWMYRADVGVRVRAPVGNF